MDRLIIIKQVMQELNKRSIKYCILRNYDFLLEERLPEKQSERSVDIAVHREDYQTFHEILTNLFFKTRSLSFSHSHIAYFMIKDNEIINFDVQIGGIYWNDIGYLGSELFSNRIKKESFYVPSIDHSFVMLLTHSILGKRYFKKEYKNRIIELYSRIDQKYVLRKLTKIFNKNLSEQLLYLILKNDFNKIISKKYKYIFVFIFKSKKNCITFGRLFLRWLSTRRVAKSHPLISIIGPDGSGKSTSVKDLFDFLVEKERKVTTIYNGRGRNQIIPFGKFGRNIKRKERIKDSSIPPNKKAIQKRKIAYTLAAPIFTLDLLLRYYLRIFPKRKTKHTVITDRYCSDILLMENVPLLFKKFLLRLFPKPSITFYLYNDPYTLKERRPKESLENLHRQLGLFKELESYFKPIKIKTNNKKQAKEIISQEVMAHLLDNWI